ncbi:hypothetical protein [Methylomarinum vadi]|uniref:hypothetical protein n=1 Tax=Methylomarinum vadi TaxID=438855 RepID=UPI0004DF13D8|nr:hypothetical protein [Methylomarinum vadi]
MTTWSDNVLGLIFQFYGLAFFSLCAVTFALPKFYTVLKFARHLNWLAGFGLLHGFFEFLCLQRLPESTSWLDISSIGLLIASFIMLLEFGRRNWNTLTASVRLGAAPLYSLLTVALILFVYPADEPLPKIELGVHYLLGAPAAWLTAYVLLANDSGGPTIPSAVSHPACPCLKAAAAGFAVYGLLTLVPSLDHPFSTSGLPGAGDFYWLTGLPVQIPKALSIIVIALSFVALNRQAGILNQSNLFRVLNTLNGFVYRCRHDRQWSMVFITEGV